MTSASSPRRRRGPPRRARRRRSSRRARTAERPRRRRGRLGEVELAPCRLSRPRVERAERRAPRGLEAPRPRLAGVVERDLAVRAAEEAAAGRDVRLSTTRVLRSAAERAGPALVEERASAGPTTTSTASPGRRASPSRASGRSRRAAHRSPARRAGAPPRTTRRSQASRASRASRRRAGPRARAARAPSRWAAARRASRSGRRRRLGGLLPGEARHCRPGLALQALDLRPRRRRARRRRRRPGYRGRHGGLRAQARRAATGAGGRRSGGPVALGEAGRRRALAWRRRRDQDEPHRRALVDRPASASESARPSPRRGERSARPKPRASSGVRGRGTRTVRAPSQLAEDHDGHDEPVDGDALGRGRRRRWRGPPSPASSAIAATAGADHRHRVGPPTEERPTAIAAARKPQRTASGATFAAASAGSASAARRGRAGRAEGRSTLPARRRAALCRNHGRSLALRAASIRPVGLASAAEEPGEDS